MATVVDLWDVASGNLIGTYESEERALTVVREALDANGEDYAHALALGSEDDDGQSHVIAKGTQLATRANRVPANEAVPVGDRSAT